MRLGAFLCPGGHHVAAWRQPGRFFEPDRLRLLSHEGEHCSICGTLKIPRPP
jgi:hypothetical protein